MNLSAKVASALSFAHLAGLGRGKAAKADDDEKKDRDREDTDDGAKKGKAEGGDDDEKDDDKKKPAEARAEDDDPDAQDEDRDDKDKKDSKAKGKASDSDDDGDGDGDDEKMRAGAIAERARCAAIFASPAAAKNIAMAAELAFNTDLSAEQAVALLAKAPAGASAPHRAAGNPRIGASGAPEVSGKQAVDSRWDRAFASVNPQKRR